MSHGKTPRGAALVTLAGAALLWSGAPARAQSLLAPGRGATLIGSDLAVLESREPRKDLPCLVTPTKPVLGFDLKFHAGFEISVPLRELAGNENLLTILFRVTSDKQKDNPAYFTQKIRVPSIEEEAKGDAYLQGTFDMGEGKYTVDWLMRDRTERVCASFWESLAELPTRDRTLELSAKPGELLASEKEEFADEPVVERNTAEGALAVKVLVNFAPQNWRASSLQPMDTAALVSMLRTLQRDPRVSRFSVVAFNLQEQRVLYRQPPEDRIDFPAIGEALKGLQLGRVDAAKLRQKNSETEFLGELITAELKVQGELPDALIFAGPKVMLQENVAPETLRVVGEPAFPVFYMNYDLYPHLTPWRDSIGHAVKFFKGQEYTISRPRDLWFAVTEMVGKIVKLRSGKHPATSASNRGTDEAVAH